MNLQTMVDTLQEVRGPTGRGWGAGPAVAGRGCGPVPSSASPPWSRGPLPPPPLRGWEGAPGSQLQKAWAQESHRCLSHAGLCSVPRASARVVSFLPGGLPAPAGAPWQGEGGLWLFWLAGYVFWALLHTG